MCHNLGGKCTWGTLSFHHQVLHNRSWLFCMASSKKTSSWSLRSSSQVSILCPVFRHLWQKKDGSHSNIKPMKVSSSSISRFIPIGTLFETNKVVWIWGPSRGEFWLLLVRTWLIGRKRLSKYRMSASSRRRKGRFSIPNQIQNESKWSSWTFIPSLNLCMRRRCQKLPKGFYSRQIEGLAHGRMWLWSVEMEEIW